MLYFLCLSFFIYKMGVKYFPGAQMVKRLSTMQETWVRSLGWEDSLEKETATHSLPRKSLLCLPSTLA